VCESKTEIEEKKIESEEGGTGRSGNGKEQRRSERGEARTSRSSFSLGREQPG